jgi:TnpA family transposase
MPKRELLSPAQRAELTAFPELDERNLIKHYTLTRGDLEFVRTRRGGSNQFGFAIELLILNHLGWSHDQSIRPSEQVIHFVAEQLHLHPALFNRYATRTQTRSEHFSELQRYFGFRPFTAARKQELREFLLPIALSTTRGLALITAALEELRARKILLPGLVTLEYLASDLLLEAERETFKQLTLGLKPELRTRLDSLLKPEDGRSMACDHPKNGKSA